MTLLFLAILPLSLPFVCCLTFSISQNFVLNSLLTVKVQTVNFNPKPDIHVLEYKG